MDHASPSSSAGSSATIFVVDDEPMLLDLALAILQPAGYDVRTFRDPQAALVEFRAAKPAVLVTYPKWNTPYYLVYADAAAKPDAFLAKPYQVREFIEAVQKLAAG